MHCVQPLKSLNTVVLLTVVCTKGFIFCRVYVGQQIKSPMSSVDYLNDYERTLLRKFSATGRSILDFNGGH